MASDKQDRTVHARSKDGREVVRYDRAGKWWIESPDGSRIRLNLTAAISEAYMMAHDDGGVVVRWGQPGGQQFDARLRKALGRGR